MISRTISHFIGTVRNGYPVIGITGPRQSGKTTLAKFLFPEKPYVTLETPSNLEFAQDDPRGFMQKYNDGAVFDEVQRAPHIFSYLLEIVDAL